MTVNQGYDPEVGAEALVGAAAWASAVLDYYRQVGDTEMMTRFILVGRYFQRLPLAKEEKVKCTSRGA